MTSVRKARLTGEQKKVLWEHWKGGLSTSAIARILERVPGSIHKVLSKHGGVAPKPRVRCARSLSLAERETISRGLSVGMSVRGIAAQLNRAPSTISREINRNGDLLTYRAYLADEGAWQRALRPKCCALSGNAKLRRLVASKLKHQWSPTQISGWLKRTFLTDNRMHLSHETIYRSLYMQARGVLKKELLAHLRTNRVMRRSKKASGAGQNRGAIVDAVSISERPAEVEDRAIKGHWEGDLISGSNNSHIATLVERHSRYVMLVKVANKDTENVVSALIKQSRRLPSELYRSLTWDRGKELADHRRLTLATEVQVYFCDP